MRAVSAGRQPRRSTKQRRGFTLLELLIASMLLTVAVMSLLSVSRSVSTEIGASRWQLTAAGLAQRRLDSLRSLPCTVLTAAREGRASAGGVTERWTVQGTGSTRTIQLVVGVPRVRSPYVYTTLVPCV